MKSLQDFKCGWIMNNVDLNKGKNSHFFVEITIKASPPICVKQNLWNKKNLKKEEEEKNSFKVIIVINLLISNVWLFASSLHNFNVTGCFHYFPVTAPSPPNKLLLSHFANWKSFWNFPPHKHFWQVERTGHQQKYMSDRYQVFFPFNRILYFYSFTKCLGKP